MLATGEKTSRRKRELYRESIDNGLIVQRWFVIKTILNEFDYNGRFFAVTTNYIEQMSGWFDNSIVFNGACKGFAEGSSLKDGFLRKGAGTYYGFTDDVPTRFVNATSDYVLQYLLAGYNTGFPYDDLCSNNGQCHDFTYHFMPHSTCLEIGGSHDIVWYGDPNIPTVTTHEVQPNDIATTTATVTGSVEFPIPNQPIEYERGFLYDTSPYVLILDVGTNQVVYPGTDLLNFSCTLTDLSPNTTYYVRAYSRWENNEVIYGDVVSFTTLNTGGGPQEYVDLGLPSGTLWATCNVGANAPEEYGDYFAWGETRPKDTYDWSTYQYCMGSDHTMTKYCRNSSYGYNGFTDNLTTLLPEDDAATANWGNGWRMPTTEEWDELRDNTTSTWTTRNGVCGRLLTAINGNTLFLPAAGDAESSIVEAGNGGIYWSGMLSDNLDYQHCANHRNFNSNGFGFMGATTRRYGYSIRPVRSTSQTESYAVNATPSPAEGGSIVVTGGSLSGTTCTLTATANEGYIFTNWTENGMVVSTNASYSFTLTGNRTLVANFTANGGSQTFTIAAIANPTNGGMVTGGGTYNQGQSCTVTATANNGYTFSNWTENGNTVSTEASYIFTVTGDRTLVANFTVNGGGGTYNGHEYVDLGLPSGTLWATCNVGANAPEEYGDYFAWGETEPKDYYDWSNYRYCNGYYNGSLTTLTKYCTNPYFGYNGFTDNLTILQPEDDVATANWGNGWRMPTKEEWQELYQNTTHTWTTQNGVNGRRFTASNGNNLFLPAAGYRRNWLEGAGNGGYYWSSLLYTDYPINAWYLYFGSGYNGVDENGRDDGRSVRAVRSARQN